MPEYRAIRSGEDERTIKGNLGYKIVLCGDKRKSKEENEAAYGEAVAKIILENMRKVQAEGKVFVFDMPTTSTPRPVWEAIKRMRESSNIDFSKVVFMGHEEGWGEGVIAGSDVDFEGDRISVIENIFGVNVRKITRVEQIDGEKIDGNYLTMRLDESDYLKSLELYKINLKKIQKRNDLKFFGFYGVGTDGHIAEQQVDSMGNEDSMARKGPYVEIGEGGLPIKTYNEKMQANSPERGLFQWLIPGENKSMRDYENFNLAEVEKCGGLFEYLLQQKNKVYVGDEKSPFASFDYGSNFFTFRKQAAITNNLFNTTGIDLRTDGKEQGKGFAGVDHIMGIGWGDMLKIDEMVIAFNNSRKKTSFRLALEGSIDADIYDESDNLVYKIERDKGMGEKIIESLRSFGFVLYSQLKLSDSSEIKNAKTCGELNKLIYKALDNVGASSADPNFEMVYKQLWRFHNFYLGQRAPVSRVVGMRTLLGLPTTLVVTSEVVEGTEYE